MELVATDQDDDLSSMGSKDAEDTSQDTSFVDDDVGESILSLLSIHSKIMDGLLDEMVESDTSEEMIESFDALSERGQRFNSF
jgi:hypothetical protein